MSKNTIQAIGQAITGTNYATDRIFNFNPEPVISAAKAFLACGVTELEIPQGMLDPDSRFPDTGIDRDTLAKTIGGLPKETIVRGTYLSSFTLGADNESYLTKQKRAIELLIEHFPGLDYATIHPPAALADGGSVQSVVDTYARLGVYAESLRPGFQLCFHNHYDSCAETAEQVVEFLKAIEAVGQPSLRWGPDTAHSHGMGERMIPVFEEYAHLIGNYFHIKARIAAFDRQHGGDAYREARDIWSNKSEVGRGLYGGFVNVADPEIDTPFGELFRIIRDKARPTHGVVKGAIEIDNPRQHPRLEVLCAVLYLKHVHGVEAAQGLSIGNIVDGALRSDEAE